MQQRGHLIRQALPDTVSLRLGHVLALALLMQFTTKTPFHYLAREGIGINQNYPIEDFVNKNQSNKADEENFRFRRRKPSERSDGVETYVERLESTDF